MKDLYKTLCLNLAYFTSCCSIMAPKVTPNASFNLRSILDREKLSRTNFMDWYRNLRIILKQEKKEYVLEEPYPNDPGANASEADRRAYEKHCDDSVDVTLMLATMSLELQK